MKKIYLEPRQRAIDIDMQNLIAESESIEAYSEEEVIVEDGSIQSLARENNLWDNEW